MAIVMGKGTSGLASDGKEIINLDDRGRKVSRFPYGLENVQYRPEYEFLRRTADGGYLFAGSVIQRNQDRTSDRKGIVIKIGRDGAYEWSAKFDSSRIFRVEEVPGGYFVVGKNNSRVLVLGLDKKGAVTWRKLINTDISALWYDYEAYVPPDVHSAPGRGGMRLVAATIRKSQK